MHLLYADAQIQLRVFFLSKVVKPHFPLEGEILPAPACQKKIPFISPIRLGLQYCTKIFLPAVERFFTFSFFLFFVALCMSIANAVSLQSS